MANKKHSDAVMDAIRGKFGKGSARRMGEASTALTEVIPTGIEIVDHYVLGCGGLPVGRMGEVYGAESSGKTSFVFASLAAAQRAGGLAMIVETEDSLDPTRAEVFGLDLDDTILFEPDTMEDVLNSMRLALNAIPDGVGPNVLAWDSLASASLEAQIAKEIGANVPGKRGKLLSEGIPQITNLAKKKRTHVMIVNQIRDKIGVMFGNPTTTPGGHSVKYHSSYRLQMWGGKPFDGKDDTAGIRVTFKATKNKLNQPHRKAVGRLDFATGWNTEWSTMELAKTLKHVKARARLSKANLAEAREKLGWPNVEG